MTLRDIWFWFKIFVIVLVAFVVLRHALGYLGMTFSLPYVDPLLEMLGHTLRGLYLDFKAFLARLTGF